jgi:hypothetical protein
MEASGTFLAVGSIYSWVSYVRPNRLTQKEYLAIVQCNIMRRLETIAKWEKSGILNLVKKTLKRL